MIERKLVKEKIREYQIQKYVRDSLKNAGISHIKIQKTPLGEKIIVHTSRPGLVVGRKGENIKQLTRLLKKEFELENPQIEIAEVQNTGLNASIMAEKIASAFERFGTKNFKGVGHKIMTEVMNSGALGIELTLSGKIPSSRAKSWRFYSGYLRKCGDVSLEGVDRAYAVAQLKSGIVGIKVSIMPPDIKLPDIVHFKDAETILKEENAEKIEASSEEKKEISAEDKKEHKKEEKQSEKKRSRKKKVKEEKDESQGNKVVE